MHRFKRTACLVVAILIFCVKTLTLPGLALAEGVHKAVDETSQVLKVAVSKSPMSLPLWVAETQGFFKQEGVQTQSIEFNGGNLCRDALITGQVNLATSTEIAFLFGAASNPDLVMLSRFVTNSTDTRFVVRRQINEGGLWKKNIRKIGTVQGTSAHYYLGLFLALQGVDASAVEVQFKPIEALAPSLAAGEIDAATFWDPVVENALVKYGQVIEEIKAPPVYSASFNISAHRSQIPGRSKQFKAFHRALALAIQYINRNPGGAATELGLRLGWTDPGRAVEVLQNHNFQLGLPSSHLLTMDRQLAWIRANRLAEVSDKATVLDFVDRSILNESVLN